MVLPAYLDGLLSSGAQAQVDEHLRSCRACPPRVQALTGIRAALSKGRSQSSRRICLIA